MPDVRAAKRDLTSSHLLFSFTGDCRGLCILAVNCVESDRLGTSILFLFDWCSWLFSTTVFMQLIVFLECWPCYA